jgi:hypothetical protein
MPAPCIGAEHAPYGVVNVARLQDRRHVFQIGWLNLTANQTASIKIHRSKFRGLPQCEMSLLAQSGHSLRCNECPLSGVKRTLINR